MSTAPQQPSYQAMEQAAEWFALLQSGTATTAEQAQWQQWLQDADNQLAWEYVERISHRFDPIRTSPERDTAVNALQRADKTCVKRRQLLFSLGALAGTGLLGWTGWRYSPLKGMTQDWLADYAAATGEIREILLPDGSQVWLNADSALNLDYSDSLRRLQLLRGEMLIQTAEDAAQRPFIVDSAQGRLLALGTRFTVRQEESSTLVSVYQGAVQARTANTGKTAVIHSGQQTHFTPQTITSPENADPAREAWSRGILIADNIPLSQVIQELNRYYKGHLSLSPELAEMTVLGSYPAKDPQQTLTMLASVMPIRIERRFSWWISIQPK